MREKKDINIEIGGNIQVAREQAGYTQDTLSDVYKRQVRNTTKSKWIPSSSSQAIPTTGGWFLPYRTPDSLSWFCLLYTSLPFAVCRVWKFPEQQGHSWLFSLAWHGRWSRRRKQNSHCRERSQFEELRKMCIRDSSCVVRTLVEVLQTFNGRVYDPCCGSGGMFVQSAKFPSLKT